MRFKPYPLAVTQWLATYEQPKPRYSVLVLHGGSQLGKTELAKKLRGRDKTLVVDCQHARHPDLHAFDPLKHEAIVLDDIAGPAFVCDNKKLLQQHADGARLGQSPAQHLAYEVSLWRVPVVVTTNFWDVAPLCPEDLDWVEQNCVVVPITSSVMVDSDEQDDV